MRSAALLCSYQGTPFRRAVEATKIKYGMAESHALIQANASSMLRAGISCGNPVHSVD
jgi:hypothetical protein